MELRHEFKDDTLVVHCDAERLDALVAIRFKDGFRAIADENVARVLLDLSTVNFMDSSGLGAVVAVYKLFRKDVVFDLAAPTAPVDRVFRLTRMDSVFRIFASLEAGLRADRPRAAS